MTENTVKAKPSSKRLLLIVAGIVLLLVIIFAVTRKAPEKHAAEAPAPIAVSAITLSTTGTPNLATASGSVYPVSEAKVAPKIMSTVSAVYAAEGDYVRNGQVLVKLESRDLHAQLAQAQAALNAAAAGSERAGTAIDLQRAETDTSIISAQAALQAAKQQLSLVSEGPRKQQKAQAQFAVAQAQAQLRNAETELNRMKRLFEQDVITRQRLDSVQTAYEVALAQFNSAKEQASLTEEGSRTQDIQTAQQQVKQAEQALRMAKAAKVQNKMSVSNYKVAASQVAQARATVDFARTQLSYATIVSPVSGVVSGRMVDPGDMVSPGIPIMTVQSSGFNRLEVTVPESYTKRLMLGQRIDVILGSDNRRVVGRIAVLSPAGDSASHKFLVKVDLPANISAMPGDFGRISFPTGYKNVVKIPDSALHNSGGLPVVYIIDQGNKARMQPVKIGRSTSSGHEVLSGLTSGDRVIVSSTGQLYDGVPVRVEGL